MLKYLISIQKNKLFIDMTSKADQIIATYYYIKGSFIYHSQFYNFTICFINYLSCLRVRSTAGYLSHI